jgi:D-alanyl-lipoteichoic acid acyltransferase DltB (MBOAT superfamily)
MGLDSAIFLLFLGCIVVVHAWLPGRWRVSALLCASLMFYTASSVNHLFLLLGLCGLNYVAVSSLSRISDQPRRTWIFAGAVTVNLTVLVAFKYAGGFIGEILARCGWHGPAAGEIRLVTPLGLSYFTFQMLACVTDAYRRTWKLDQGFVQFALFGLFFPQISSGPIPRAERLLPQLAGGGCPTTEDRLAGLRLIAYGFFKKYVVANRLNEYVSVIFTLPSGIGTLPVLVACCFNALQLYADFSGYVDIAIGSARLLGIRLDPNFDRPLTSTSVTELWRRWHMTLSFWLRDYIYMPLLIRIRTLGKFGVVLALVVTFAICGIWHAATWTYLLFGISQGLAMSAEFLTKSWRARRLKRMPKRVMAWAGNIYTLGFFVLTQVLFRSASLSQARGIFSHLFHLQMSGMFVSDSPLSKSFFLALDCAAIGAWIGVAYFCRRTSDRSTPWFVLICALLILFLGHLGSAHFIYAAF